MKYMIPNLPKMKFLLTNFFKLSLLSLLILFSWKPESSPKTGVSHLRCEHLERPMGLDTSDPRFQWRLESDREGAFQKGYEIVVGTDSVAVSKGLGNMWTTDANGPTSLVAYGGKELEPFTKYFWAVRITDDRDQKSDLALSSFETGMMDQKNWQGSWITDADDIHFKPAPYFRKTIKLDKKVQQARAYITAAGLFELSINGKKIGDHRLDPMYTRFDKRNLYVTHDVTKELKGDSITMGVLLGNGWYNHQSTAVWNFHKAGWRDRPRFLMDLKIVYEDGSTATISSDESWKTDLGALTFNSIYTAEHYDANKEQKGWDSIGFDDTNWKNAVRAEAPSPKITAQALHPIRNVEEIKPVNLQKMTDTSYVFDLGRNISGVVKIRLQGPKGTVVRVTHAEQLDSLGNVDLSNIDVHYRPTDNTDPFQTDIYTLNGGGTETFMPKFNYKGFQYVEVSSSGPLQLTKESLTGLFMHSDVPSIGAISSSNELINKIWAATNASYLSNLFGYPTDCPQREKNGWTGDAHIAIETGLYNFDGITIYEKWLADHRDEQQENGVLPSIIPTWGGWGYDWGNGPDWTSTIAIIPWEMYQFYGDDRALRTNYDNIKKYVDHITEISPTGLTDWGLGDWVPVQDVTPKELTSSIYYYVDADILAKTAKHLGKENDYKMYSELTEKIKKAINDKYLDPETGLYGSGFQTELSAPLYWGIVPQHLAQKVADNLAQRVLKDKKHINVGLLGAKSILNALSENGHADLAYEMASQETFPSWGWWIKNGATTLYENWPIDASSDISRNHIMFGEIGAWFFKGLGGIFPDPKAPGFKNVLLRPNFVKDLQFFNASHIGPYGEIVSHWKRDADQIKYRVVVPPNSTATVQIKAKSVSLNGTAVDSKGKGDFEIALSSGENQLMISE